MFTTVKHSRSVIALVMAFTLIISPSVLAEQKKTYGKHDVHYVASNTAMLTPTIAKAYNIQRSKSRGIVTIAVRDTDKNSASEALVRGSVKNPIGQLQALDFTKVVDQEAIYYLATFSFADEQKMNFDVLISPEGVAKSHVLQFEQQFFVE